MIPSVPGNFYVQMGNNQILLTWNNVPGATSYSIQRSIDGVNYTTVATPVINSYLDTTVLSGIQYFYQIASVGAKTLFATSTLTLTGLPNNGDTFSIGNIIFTAVTSGATGNQFNIGGTPTVTATNLVASFNNPTTAPIASALSSGNIITFTATDQGTSGNGLQASTSLTNSTLTPFSGGGVGSMSNYTSTQTNGLPATQIPTTSGQMTLYQLRLLSQQMADRVNSTFVSMPEWNSYINLAADELYDLITTVYDDYQMYQPIYFTTGPGPTIASVCQGCMYTVVSLGTTTTAQWVYLGAPSSLVVGTQFVAQQSAQIPGTGTVQISGSFNSQSYPMPDGIQPFRDAAGNIFVPPPIYKLSGIDLGLNNAPNGFVTVSKYNFIDRNRYVFPNTASTIYGVFGLQYRFIGYTIRFIPTPSSSQPIGLWYIPRRVQLLQDTDISEGYNGWIRYVIVRAAKYALDKEESDTSKLDSEILFLKNRIEASAPNRDEGQADTISDARSAQGYGPDGSSGGGWGGPQGYGW